MMAALHKDEKREVKAPVRAAAAGVACWRGALTEQLGQQESKIDCLLDIKPWIARR
jgi:hypothetical protein